MTTQNQEQDKPSHTSYDTSSSPSPLLQDLHAQGFIIIPSFLTPSELSSLRKASSSITSLARQGDWPHIRTTSKQFPPWPTIAPPASEGGIWGVQHLLHPLLPLSDTDKAAFIRLYFSPRILGVVTRLLGVSLSPSSSPEEPDSADSVTDKGGKEEGEGDEGGKDAKEEEEQGGKGEELVMELLNLLVRPDKPFSLVWHRDDIPPSATPEEELSRLTAARQPPPSSTGSSAERAGRVKYGYNHTQWNLPLYDDASLILIPGSHARARTEQERAADPYETLPGQITVDLKAGDIAFYDNDILHRGVYEHDKERLTLHGSVGLSGAGTKRARNVLQHGVGSWVDGCDFGGVLRGDRLARGLQDDEELAEEDERLVKVAEGMRRRLVQMGRTSGNVGFSLSG